MRGRTTRRTGWLEALAGYPVLATLLCVCLWACASDPSPPAAPITAGPADAKGVVAVLVAGDDSLQVFDNAINYMADTLAAAGVPPSQIHRLSALPRRAPETELATQSAVLNRLESIHVPPGGSCLVYMTSHGAYNRGLYLAASDDLLTAAALDHALSQGCGTAPTVVIMSSCFAGQFTFPPMPRPNRIILTAADANRTSFGCGASFRFTYFDECFLGSLGRARTWQEVFGRSVTCVAQRERQIGALPSQPTASFGAEMDGVGPPTAPHADADPLAIHFDPGNGPFDPALAPLPAEERLRLSDALARYAAALPPKALAMTAQGLLVPVARGRDGRRSEDDVARIALQRCEWLAGGACILYARDEHPVALMPSGLAPFHPPLLVRAGLLTPAVVPFIRDDQRPQIEHYLTSETPKALALSPGHEEIGVGHGPSLEDARRDALAQCRAGRLDCVIYAEDDRIVLGWTN